MAVKRESDAQDLKKYRAIAAKPAHVGPSLALVGYGGTFADPWYGDIEIGNSRNTLTIDFKSTPRLRGTLKHWQYDTFVTHFDDATIEPAYVTFDLKCRRQNRKGYHEARLAAC